MVAHLTVQQWNLNDDAAMGEAVHKGVRNTLRHPLAFIVLSTGGDIQYRLLDGSNAMSQQIDGHHGKGVLTRFLAHHVFLAEVLGA